MTTPDPHTTSRLDDCRIIDLPRHHDPDGTLCVLQNPGPENFEVRRVFYLYDVPTDSERGGHSHRRSRELIIALAGSFDVVRSDGLMSRRYTLRRPYQALYIPAGIWRTLDSFSAGAVCTVLTTEKYSEDDYVRDIDEFKRLTAVKNGK